MEDHRNPSQHPVIVIGGGPAGLTAAIALAEAGVPTALVARSRSDDRRTSALLHGSVTALDTLGVWTRCERDAAPLRRMRIVDDTVRLIRAPEVCFDAGEIGLDAFGYNIENRHLLAALDARAAELPRLQRFETDATSVVTGDRSASVTLADGRTLTAPLVVGADGHRSLCRAAAGIESDSHRYGQTALTFNLSHSRSHRDTSTEFHTESGPFTVVPLPGLRSSLVWVMRPFEARRVAALDPGALAAAIERRAHSLLGSVRVEPGYGTFPLGVATTRGLARRRIALVGEAAHLIPPIGAQGLNLGLRDAAAIADLVAGMHRHGGADGGSTADLGADAVLNRYEATRRTDVATRGLAVDLLNRSLLTGFLPVQGARGLGLYLMDRIGPFRRAVLREGVAPMAGQPRLMRGEPL